MDIRRLKHFVTLAETLHFGKAAEKLNMTQPPLSQSIMVLEKELGGALFIRTKRNVSLTSFGEQWLIHVKDALSGVNSLSEIADRLKNGESGRLDLSFISVVDYSILPDLVRNFRQSYPEVELRLTEATSDIQLMAILDEKMDAGIIIAPLNGTLPAVLNYQKILSEPFISAIPSLWLNDKNLRIIDNKICPSSIINSPLILFPQQLAPGFHALVTRFYAFYGAKPDIIQHAIQMQTIISLVASGMGMALVPLSLRHLARTGVVYLELLSSPPELEVGIVWHKKNSSPMIINLIEMALATHEKRSH